ncbi:MAG: CerR family C-terminal domain-containing protein [Alphaproteobacteria bacterium]|nr:CerR family C-terminal domain-containing protein [Alphaproteobacteria bacterium]MBT4018507.1 CerR family C-terminal domain-containing protein [Alphaproteobacteria bacterium]MBT5162159.1 CerR family C-terminal domain-containing protein [Alphaproteobacteria bacterium]MBT5919556.1 CerR family C-terminal domain-containing protein [Alphaproteobacteria bacterium]MBT6385400.1 CerR family C-terminal domain-containing protein [Alphaproteobacteria bacterium]
MKDIKKLAAATASVDDGPAMPAMRRGRPPKGNAAEGRKKLLVAAITLFSEQGPDSVSTRQLAQAAGVNLSAITYHFGGKDALYEAAIRQAIDDLAPRRQMLINYLETILRETDGDQKALAKAIGSFVKAFFAVLVKDDFPLTTIRLLMRELHHPTTAFSQVIDQHIDPVQDAIARLAAVATNCDVSDPQVRLLGLSVTSQIFMLGIMRPVVLSRMGWSDYSADNANTVIKLTTTSILRLLGLPENIDRFEDNDELSES